MLRVFQNLGGVGSSSSSPSSSSSSSCVCGVGCCGCGFIISLMRMRLGMRWRRPCAISLSATTTTTTTNSSSSTGRPSAASACKTAPGFGAAIRMCASPSQSAPDALPSPSSPSVAFQTSVNFGDIRNVSFCQWCGGPTKHEVPDGEEKMRAVCTVCRKITYQNPRMVVGCLIEHENKVLLCRRKIQPSYGLWTLPAGYLEIGESAIEGAMRETWEEAGAEVEVRSPFAQLDIPLIGQTYIIFLAKLKKPHFSPGPESLECRLYALDDIPFDSLAFSSMVVTLSLYVKDLRTGIKKFHYGTINKRPGTSPSDSHAYTLDDHLEC